MGAIRVEAHGGDVVMVDVMPHAEDTAPVISIGSYTSPSCGDIEIEPDLVRVGWKISREDDDGTRVEIAFISGGAER